MGTETKTYDLEGVDGTTPLADLARANALSAIAARAAARLQRERVLTGAKKIGPKQAEKAAEDIGADVILSLAQAATSEDPLRLTLMAAGHRRKAREDLLEVRRAMGGRDDVN